MKILKHASGPAIAIDTGLDNERLCLAAEQSAVSFGMSILLLVVAGVLFEPKIDAWLLASGGAIISVYLARVLMSKRFLAIKSNRKNQSSWSGLFFVSAALSGLAWGLFAMLMILHRSPETDLFSMFLVVGLTAGAIPTLGALSRAYVAYVIALLLPAIVGFAFRGGQFGLSFALLGFGYSLFLMMTAVNFRRRLDTWLRHARENAQLSHFSRHDSLTGLPNKREFEAEIQRSLRQSLKRRQNCVLLYVDLDQFKVINDTCGHATGDEVLQQVSVVVWRLIRRQDSLGRLGGDEFGILLRDCDLEEANHIATLICRSLKQHQFYARDRSFRLTASIGLAATGSGLESLHDLLSAAESASYVAKESGRDRVHIYHQDDSLLFRRNREMQWAMEIPEALDAGRFYLECQTIVAVGDEPTAGRWCEVLLRMRNPDGNTVMPGEFLPAAERYNLAVQLDIWVVKTVLESLENQVDVLENLELCFINISGQSMGDEGFMDKICMLLKQSRVPADRLCFEITETAAVNSLSQALALMQRLRSLGCRFALDDFGSGLSSFGYLRDFPVDFIKIDGAFVRDIVQDPVNRAIVASINEIGHTTNKLIIAEFVENQPILECLREIGVDYAQGYGIDVPGQFPGSPGKHLPQRMSA